MKKSKILLTVVTTFISMFLLNVSIYAEEMDECELQEFAECQLERLLECEAGELVDVVDFSDIQGETSAYLYQYENAYIVTGVNEKYCPIIEFGEGEFVLNAIIEENNIDSENVELVYTGALNYGFISDEKCYVFSNNKLKKVKNKEKMKCNNIINHSDEWAIYDATKSSSYVSGEVINPDNYERYYYNLTVKNVPNYNFPFEIMSNFSGYSSHCSPTAAVNLMKYWYLRNNSLYNSLLKSSWYNTFTLFHSYMGTTDTDGTYTSMLDRAYAQYLWSCGFSNYYVKLYKKVSTNVMINEIKNGYPFHLNVYGSSYYGSHSVLALGYRAYTYFEHSMYSTVYYFRIADGWHSSSRYVNVNVGLNSMDAVVVHIN